MTLLSYKVFMTVVEQMNYRKAAELLNLTPSAISHCISGMEEELGFPLFNRKKNRISLTSDAETLIPYVKQLLACEASLNQVVGEIKGMTRGVVRLGCFNSVCTCWIPKLVAEFKRQYPGIELELYQGAYADIVEWIENGTVDIGFLSVSSAGNIPIEPLYHDRLMAVVPKGFKTRHKDYISIDELKGYEYVQPSENCDADSQMLFEKYGFEAQSTIHVVDDLSILTMVQSGFGVCILPKMTIDACNAEVDIYPIRPDEYRVIGVACYGPSKNVPSVQKMYQVILDNFLEK